MLHKYLSHHRNHDSNQKDLQIIYFNIILKLIQFNKCLLIHKF